MISSTDTPATNNPNHYLFTGRRIDILDGGDLKIMYYRYRYYSPTNGRFLSHDMFGLGLNSINMNIFMPYRQYSDGMSLYQYVKNNPVNMMG